MSDIGIVELFILDAVLKSAINIYQNVSVGLDR